MHGPTEKYKIPKAMEEDVENLNKGWTVEELERL